uniref:ATP synthase complex subunit 8 n=1 Tax=Incoltorrida madagassica TaxID=442089 RepID=A0A343A3L1_9COLE|nr:ATP synthase F0 subunit 8 [Incoltorrida madagassica]AOY39139.1 ATP synthase F0 subunit 8 [Incoltorrida madagassica]
MPQMSPLNWLFLMFFFIVIYFLMNNFIYFYKNNNINTNKLEKMKLSKFNWKW